MNTLQQRIKAIVDQYVTPEMASYVNMKIGEVFKQEEYLENGGMIEDLPLETKKRMEVSE